MTRENKLALVVGFALILVVGILVSDHFSVARAQETASLADAVAASEPLMAMRQSNPDLILAGRGENDRSGSIPESKTVRIGQDTPPAPPTTIARDILPPRDRALDPAVRTPVLESPAARDAIARANDLLAGRGANERSRSTTATEHVVRPRETLTTICRAKYGSEKYINQVAAFNDLDDPDHVRTGQKILLPTLAALGVPDGVSGSGSHAAPAVRLASYTVEEGDNLSSIAGKVLGSRNLFHRIYKANQDQLESPDDLRPGMTLRIPD